MFLAVLLVGVSAACASGDSPGSDADIDTDTDTDIDADTDVDTDADTDTGGGCAPPLVVCSGVCVDTGTDFDHCGGCEDACDPDGSDTCRGGVCRCGDEGPACEGGAVLCCDPGCRDTNVDWRHCGGCGNACDPDVADTCSDGVCVCGDEGRACRVGTALCCDGSCRNPDWEMQHCGGCDMPCDERRADQCAGGECRCGDEPECGGAGEECCRSDRGSFCDWEGCCGA